MTLMVPQLGFVKAERESTYGTDPDTDPVGLVLTEEPDLPIPSSQNVQKPRVRPDGGREPHGVIDEMVEFSFQTVIANLPYNDNSPHAAIAPILIASGFSESLSGSTASPPVTATYTPTRTGIGSATFKFYVKDKDNGTDYVKLVLKGCRCTFDIDYAIGQEVLVNVEGMAKFAKWNDFADVSSEQPSSFHQDEPTFQTQDCSFTRNSNSRTITNWSLDIANDLQPIEDITATSTLKEVRCNNVAQGMGGSYDPLVESVNASNDQMDERRTGNEASMNLDINRSNQKWHVTASNTQLDEDPSLDADGAHYRYGSSFVVNSGSPELEFKWEASA